MGENDKSSRVVVVILTLVLGAVVVWAVLL